MKFLAVPRSAVEALAGGRTFQSTEFDAGANLEALLLGHSQSFDTSSVVAVPSRQGVCLLARDNPDVDVLVFDLETSGLFQAAPTSKALMVFQKVLRFALRYWNGHKFNSNELIIPDSSKAVVFPFPISSQSMFRVTIERKPDHKRVENRPKFGNCLLAFRFGTIEGLGIAEVPSVANFRKALEALEDSRERIPQASPVVALGIDRPFLSTTTTEIHDPIDGILPYDGWMARLTTRQREFVEAELIAPHRVEGPAGSGKTLSLVLKAITLSRRARSESREHHAIFVCHSDATRGATQRLFDSIDADGLASRDREMAQQSIMVTTLHALCGRLLKTQVSETEFLDRDALESKNTQLLFVSAALEESLSVDLKTFEPFLSKEFQDCLRERDTWALAEALQTEISVVVKGRAGERFDVYKSVKRPENALPLVSEGDRHFVFAVFRRYQEQLRAASQFDTDDVVLSALGQLDTPIWRRRREREGFDAVFLDETHLFNLNELSIFHYLTRSELRFAIAYSADVAQSLQDRGWTDESLEAAISATGEGEVARRSTRMRAVFRSSPEITNLATLVAASGAMAFSRFDALAADATSAFGAADERKAIRPSYREFGSDGEMIAAALIRADELCRELGVSRTDIAVVVFDDALLKEVHRAAESTNRVLELLTRRGDLDAVRRARSHGRGVLSSPDYIGGLEFAGVVLIGVDGGRVPAIDGEQSAGIRAYQTYAAHSRLYVAITRAKLAVEIFGNRGRGPSSILRSALAQGVLSAV